MFDYCSHIFNNFDSEQSFCHSGRDLLSWESINWMTTWGWREGAKYSLRHHVIRMCDLHSFLFNRYPASKESGI